MNGVGCSRYSRVYLTLAWFILVGITAFGQSKVNITSSLPSSIDVCGNTASFQVTVRNITTSSVSGVVLQIELPSGLSYKAGSVSGTGVTEKNISNLSKPTFDLATLSVTGSIQANIEVLADCDVLTYMNNGGIPRLKALATYSGGSNNHTSLPITINQPVVNVTTITNQFYTGNVGERFVRTYTISNNGKGSLAGFFFKESIQSGLKRLSRTGGIIAGDTVYFDGSVFASLGNKDSFFGPGESVVVTDTIQIVACSKLSGSATLAWGCNGKYCNTTSYNNQVSIKTIAPKLSVVSSSQLNACFDVNKPVSNQLMVVNTGSDSARNTIINVFQSASSGFYGSELSSIDTSTLRMRKGLNGTPQKVSIVKTRLNLTSGIRQCLGTSPIAAMDIAVGVLLPGDTIYLDWESNSCCPSACFTSFYAHRWKYTSSCVDQCGTDIAQTEQWGSTGYYHGFALSAYGPTDIVDNDTVKLLFTVTTGSLLGNSNNSVLDVYVELPAGIRHSLQKSHIEFRTHDGSTWTPNSVSLVGDSVHAVFNGRVPIKLVNSDLTITLIGDCSGTTANKDESYNVNISYRPDKTCNAGCTFQHLCYTGKMKVHCDKQCSSGLRFSKFDVERISYGLPDNDNDGLADATGSLDMDNIRTERVCFGDTVQTVFKGKINRQGSITTWTRLTATSTIPYGKYLEVADARIRIIRNGKQLYSCNQLNYNYSTIGNDRTFTYDLGVSSLISASCPLYSGFAYTTADSVELHVKYVVATNPGNFLQEVELSNSFYLHTVANPNSAQRYQCDTFSGKFVLFGTYFTNCCRGVYSSTGCNELTVSQNYYLSVGPCCSNYTGGNIFPKEYRRWARPERFFVIPPKGFDIVRTRFYAYRTAGTGSSKYDIIDSVQQTTVNGDTVELDVSSYFVDKGGKVEISDDGFYGVCYYTLKPNCEAVKGSSRIYYGYSFQKFNSLGIGLDTMFNPTHSDEIVYERPSVEVTTLSDDVQAVSDTAVWQIKVTNSSSTATAQNVWLSNSDNGNTRVESVVNLATGKAVPVNNGIFQLGSLKVLSSGNYEVRAVFTNCDRDSFKLYMGHDCRSYPDSLADAPCIEQEKTLLYTPKNTLLTPEIALSDTVIDLCADTYFDVTVRNLGSARAFKLSLDLFLPQGLAVTDSALVYLSAINDSFWIYNPTDLGAGKFRWDITSNNTYLNKEGLSGITFSGVNTYTVRFGYTTNCDFVSSTYMLVRPGGELRCGNEVLSNYAASKPIDIKNIVKPYFSFVEFEKRPINVCNYDGLNTAKFINLGPDTTGVNDYIQLILPKGVYVDTNYLQGIRNVPTDKPSVKNKDRYIASWKLPSGIVAGDSSVFSYKTYVVPSELSCGATQVYMQSVVSQPALCVRDSSWCSIDVSTSNDLQLDSILKGDYVLQPQGAGSVASANGEVVQFTYDISNLGAVKDSAVPFVIKIIADTNGNGKADVGENLVATDTIYQKIDKAILSRSISFETSSANVCHLLMVIDSSNCVCSPTYQPVGTVHLDNAGRDTIACSRLDISIGTASMPGVTYKWLNPTYIADADSAQTYFNAVNTTADTKEYQLILETDRGTCTSRDTVWIELYSAMLLSLKDTVDICEGERILIGEVPVGGEGFKTYQWTPSDSLSNPNGVKAFANPSRSTLYSIEIVDDGGCKVVDSTMVMVRKAPIAGLSFRDTCAGIPYTLQPNTVLGDAGLDSVDYRLSNGDAFVNSKPVFIPDTDTTIHIFMFVRDSFGCSDTTGYDFTPYSNPIDSFTLSGNCQYDVVNALNLTTIKTGSFTTTWYYQTDSAASTNLTYTAQSMGWEVVRMKTTSDRGCESIYTDSILIQAKPDLLVITDNVCSGNQSEFTVSTNVALDSLTWYWGDGNSTVSAGDTNHLYGNYGSYVVNVFGVSNAGCKDTTSVIQVVHPNPNALFGFTDVCLGDSNTVFDLSTVAQGSISERYWDFGTGYSQGDSVAKMYKSTSGTYPVQLIVVSDSSCADTSNILQPTVLYTEVPSFDDSDVCSHKSVLFTSNPIDQDSVAKYEWNIDGGTTQIGKDIAHSGFTSIGNKEVILKWTFTNGCVVYDTQSVLVKGSPKADFNWQTPCADDYVILTANSSARHTGSLSHSWDLGDGSADNGDDVEHDYGATGSYDVECIAMSDEGCADTILKQIVIDNLVIPGMVVNDVCVFDTVWLKEKSVGRTQPISKSLWTLGDGGIRQNADSIGYAYRSPGNYTVNLEYETAPGCVYNTSGALTVHDLPTAGFMMNPERADVVNSEVQFTSTAIDADSTHYAFSHGYQTDEVDFIYRFPDTAVYSITQTVVNQYGCRHSFTDEIIIDFVVNVLIPNAFSPNSDIHNPTFSPQGLGIGSFEMKVFNRWGEEVFQTTGSEAWTGENAIPGAYFYLITVLDYEGIPHHYSGIVHLLR